MRINTNNRQTRTETINGDKAAPIISYLRQGEALLWSGQPNPHCYQKRQRDEAKPMFIGGSLLTWVFSLISLAMNGLCSFTVLLFAIGCVVILCFNTIGKGHVTPKWWYAVTDQRVLSNYPTEDAQEIWQLSLGDIHNVKVKKHQAGVGTISFNSAVLVFHTHLPFECVDDAETVCNLINDARYCFIGLPPQK